MSELRWVVATSLRYRYLVGLACSPHDLWHQPDSSDANRCPF